MPRLNKVFDAARAAGKKIATAESCTGGMLATVLTALPGSSEMFERGFVTYSNEAKCEELDVTERLIKVHGAVSAEVAEAMAKGALAHSKAHIAVSITGIAGPDGGSEDKPVGLVYIGIAQEEGVQVERYVFKGNRPEIRQETVRTAMELLLKAL